MNALLERLGLFVSRHRWWVLGVWVLMLLGAIGANRAAGGDFVNDYTVPGSESADGLDVLDSDFSGASGYSGQIVFHAGDGKKVSSQQSAVKKAIGNIRNLDHVIKRDRPAEPAGHARGVEGRHHRLQQRVVGRRTGLARRVLPRRPGRRSQAGARRRHHRGVRRRRRPDRSGTGRRALRGDRARRGPGAPAHHVRVAGRRTDPPGRCDLQRRHRPVAGRSGGRGHPPADHRPHGGDAARSRRGRRLRAVPGGPASRAARPRHGHGRVDRQDDGHLRCVGGRRRQHGRHRDPRALRLRRSRSWARSASPPPSWSRPRCCRR